MVSALCGYAVLYLAARDLEPAGFSVFAVFWGAFGLLAGAANGLLQESTREVREAQADHGARRLSTARGSTRCGWPSSSAWSPAAVVVGTSPLWSGHVFVDSRLLSVALLAAGIAGFCMHATLLGVLAGVNRWSQYGSLIVGDATGAGGRGHRHLPGRVGSGRLPVGDRRGFDRLAGAPAGVADQHAPRRGCSPPAPP